jgi:hypothetical protein
VRPLYILVADLQCAATIRGLFGRDRFYDTLGCGPFEFNPDSDLGVEPTNDPGVWKKAHVILRPRQSTHEHAIVILDKQWEGSPPLEIIEQDISQNVEATGWAAGDFEVVVIDPELENWIWQDNVNVEAAFGHTRPPSLRERLNNAGLWPSENRKPPDPKKAVETANQWYGFGPASPVFKEIASTVSVRRCMDQGFRKMRDALQEWFPAEQ